MKKKLLAKTRKYKKKNNRTKQEIEQQEGDAFAQSLLESQIRKDSVQSIFTQKGLLAYKQGRQREATALKRTYDPNKDQVLALAQKMDPSQKILDNTAKTGTQAKKQKMSAREMAELFEGNETDY